MDELFCTVSIVVLEKKYSFSNSHLKVRVMLLLKKFLELLTCEIKYRFVFSF